MLPFPGQHFTFLHISTPDSFPIRDFAPFQLSSSTILWIFSFQPLLASFSSLLLVTWQKHSGKRLVHKRHFWWWYLTFSWSFCWMILISSAKAAQLWNQPVEKESLKSSCEAGIPLSQWQGLAFVWNCGTCA